MTQGVPGLGDREIAEDLLTSEKFFSDLYNKAVVESTDPQVRNTFRQIHDDVQNNAKRVFDYLNSKGWYRVTQVDPQMFDRLTHTVNEAQQAISRRGVGQLGYESPHITAEAAGIRPPQDYYQSPDAYGVQAGGHYSQAGTTGSFGLGQTGGHMMNPYVQQGTYQNPGQGGIYQDVMSQGQQGGYAGQSGFYQNPYYSQAQVPNWARTETFGPQGTRYGVGASGYGSGLQQGVSHYGGGQAGHSGLEPGLAYRSGPYGQGIQQNPYMR